MEESFRQRNATGTRLWGVQRSATVALSHLLENLDQTVPPELVHACSDADPRIRAAAIAAIATVAPESPSTIDALLRALTDKYKTVRFSAAVHLGGLSDPRAKDAVPELISAAMDKRYQRRRTAVKLLGELKSAAAVPALIEMLNHKHLVISACLALGEIGPPARAANPVLKKLAENRGHIGKLAIRTLGAIQSDDVIHNEQE